MNKKQKKQPKFFEDSVALIVEDLKELLISKQRDYGSRNIMDCGTIGVIVRINDKVARLKNLYGVTEGSFKQKPASNESVEDTFKDIANYAVIALMLAQKAFDLPLKKKE
jgi:hypothetical protein